VKVQQVTLLSSKLKWVARLLLISKVASLQTLRIMPPPCLLAMALLFESSFLQQRFPSC